MPLVWGLACMHVRTNKHACYACLNVCAYAGINTAIYSPSGANSGVGFAIPVDIVRSSVDQIIRFGRVIRPILGISFAPDQSSEQVSPSSLTTLTLANPHILLQSLSLLCSSTVQQQIMATVPQASFGCCHCTAGISHCQ